MTNIYSIFFVHEFICSMLPPCHVMSFYTQNSCIAKQKNPQIQSTSNPPSFFLCWCYSCMHSLSLSFWCISYYYYCIIFWREREREEEHLNSMHFHGWLYLESFCSTWPLNTIERTLWHPSGEPLNITTKVEKFNDSIFIRKYKKTFFLRFSFPFIHNSLTKANIFFLVCQMPLAWIFIVEKNIFISIFFYSPYVPLLFFSHFFKYEK